MKITFVTHDSVYARFLAAGLHDAGVLHRVVVETGRASRRFYFRKLRRIGLANAVFQYWLSRRFEREGRRHLPPRAFPPHETTRNVNQLEVADDELPLGFGTGYVTQASLVRMPHGFLNLHTGILPDYRGVKSEFWTLARDDVANAGWTLHFMSPELDAGDIVLQRRVRIDTRTPAAVRASLVRDAVPALVDFLTTVHTPEALRAARRPQGEGRYFTTPTWRDWREYGRRRRSARER
jgi:methionyl-tRNA formyltransferase